MRREIVQTFARVSVRRSPVTGAFYVYVDGTQWPHISRFTDETGARYFALGLAQALEHGRPCE